jgi:hypothetical protein
MTCVTSKLACAMTFFGDAALVALVIGTLVAIGSTNFDDRAFEINDEITIKDHFFYIFHEQL